MEPSSLTAGGRTYEIFRIGGLDNVERLYRMMYARVGNRADAEDLTAEVRASFDDVTQLGTATAFRDVTVARTPDGDTERVVVTIRHPTGTAPKRATAPGVRFSFAFPGRVLEANRHAETAGSRATWTFSLADYLREPIIDLRARYSKPRARPTEDS